MAEVEQRVSSAEDVQREHLADLHMLKTKVRHPEARVEDAKNRNRQKNLRVLELPEGAEGNHPNTFTESLLHTLLPRAYFSTQFVVERAHRILPVRGPQGAPPRTLIFKLLTFRDRDLVLWEARNVGELKCENTLFSLTIPLKPNNGGNHLTMSKPTSVQKALRTVCFSLQDGVTTQLRWSC